MKICPSFLNFEAKSKHRPKNFVGADFHRLGVFPTASSVSLLRKYSHAQYRALLNFVFWAKEVERFDQLKVDSASVMGDFDLGSVDGDFLSRKLVRGRTLDLRDINFKSAVHLKELSQNNIPCSGLAPAGAVMSSVEKQTSVPYRLGLPSVKYLSEDLMFNPKAPYPESALAYRDMLRSVTDPNGVFPGDHEAPPPGQIVDPSQKGVKTFSLVRKGKVFTAQFFDPAQHAPGIRNRLIFTFDMLTQMATFGALGVRGCSYDRVAYCENRYFTSDVVGIILYQGMPVSFAAVTQLETMFHERPLKYVFIHAVMTVGSLQGVNLQQMGLTSYNIREIGSSMYYRNVWENEKMNPHVNKDGDLGNERFRLWAAAHSGRAPVWHAFSTSFNMAPPEGDNQGIVRRAIIESADQKITGDRRGRPLVAAGPNAFRDERVYPPQNRYPVVSGKAVIPQKERELSTYSQWFDMIGGDEGIAAGHSLYMAGEITFGKIRAAKKREKMREGGGAVENFIDNARGRLISKIGRNK